MCECRPVYSNSFPRTCETNNTACKRYVLMSGEFIVTHRFYDRKAALLLIGNLHRSRAVYVKQSINIKYCVKCPQILT